MDDRSIRPQKFLVFSTRWACKSVGVQESLCAQWRCICLLSSWAEMGDQIIRTPLGSASKPFAALAELAILLKSQHDRSGLACQDAGVVVALSLGVSTRMSNTYVPRREVVVRDGVR